MKQDKHELTYKKFIKAEKRLNEIYKLQRNVPWRKLDEPYQDGWKLSIILREDFMRSDAGPIVKTILDKFATKSYINNPKHISQIRKKPTLTDVRALLFNKFTNYSPGIRSLSESEFDKLSAQQKKYFDRYPNMNKSAWDTNDWYYALNVPSHYLLVKVDKYMIGQVQDIDPILLKEEAELKKILAPYYRTFGYGEGYYHYFEKRAERRQSKVELTKIELE